MQIDPEFAFCIDKNGALMGSIFVSTNGKLGL